MKKLFVFITVLGILSLACQTLMPTPAAPVTATLPPVEVNTSIVRKLQELGGTQCAEQPDLTCVTLQVPLDHFDAANTETIDVVFAVLPAFGERYGMYVQAYPGGPGGEGISSAYTGYFSDSVLEHYDIVYYDQRGIGLSNPLECPVTYEEDFLGYMTGTDDAGEEGADTPEEQAALVEDTRKYIEDCVAEIGIDPAKLAFFGTNQVAEDIEFFRATIGDEKFWMYGVSYGTAVAQTYAYAYPDRLAGLVLDGTINMILKSEESVHGQEMAFEKVLLAVLNACNDDVACAADMGGKDAVAVYDDLATELADKPIDYEFPLASGETVNGKFTFNQLEYIASAQLYSLVGRMTFLKALAATQQGDYIPMMRLMYYNATIDPATFDYIGDPSFSDTMFLGVYCTDDQFFSGTQEERIAQSIEAGQASNGTVPRLDGSLYSGVSCALWPASPTESTTREPLVLEGVPTFVLNATLDPATPFEEGKFVAENLANGYHIYVEGGVHSIYGWGNECPDDYITNFLVDGTLPAQREIMCTDWETEPYTYYTPNLPEKASDFDSLIDMIIAIEENLYYLPEVYFGDWEEETVIGCTYGGAYSFGFSSDGAAYAYDHCSMIPGVVLTGTASYNSSLYVFNSTLAVSGEKEGNLSYVYNYQTQTASLTGDYGGESINQTR